MQNPAYFLRFLDILRSPGGKPLLEALAASEDKLVKIFGPLPTVVEGAPELEQQQQQRAGAYTPRFVYFHILDLRP